MGSEPDFENLSCRNVEFRPNLYGTAITGEAGWVEVDEVEHEDTEHRNGRS